jgi:hypothetical protein
MAVQTVENVVFNCVPILSTAARIAIVRVPAMRAYSMAVVADSSPEELSNGYSHGALLLAQPGCSLAVIVRRDQFLQNESDRMAFMNWRKGKCFLAANP